MDADALEFARALISPRASEELGERAADFDWLVASGLRSCVTIATMARSRRMRVTAPVIDAFLCASWERRRTSAFAYDDRTHAFAHQLCNEVGASQGTH
jgi:hypothetical protein